MYQDVIKYIKELYKTDKFIPLHAPTLQGNEKKYILDCIDSTFVSSVGKYVDLFEQKIAEYIGVKRAIVCVNGTNAIQMCLQILGVKQGDEVITQALTFVATANAISYLNAIPVFVDVDKDTMGLSPSALKTFLLENAILKNGVCLNKNTGRTIKACVPMHTFGHACRIEELLEICTEYNIELIEDAAEAMGSRVGEKHLGTFGRMSAISFNGNKIMTTGGGGMIITNDEKLASRAKHLTTQAKVPHKWEYVHDAVGYNFRMPNINAALGVAQLEQLDTFIVNKRLTAEKYNVFFKDNEVKFFKERASTFSNYWLNAVILKDKHERDAFLEALNSNGVMARPIWKLMNKLEMFKDCPKGELSNSQWLEDRVVNLPSSVKI